MQTKRKNNPGAGRPKIKEKQEDYAVAYSVSLVPADRDKIMSVYGSLTKAMKTLIPAK